jgi:hypothetical protein
MSEFKLVRITPIGGVMTSPLSPEAAAKRDREAFLKLYEEMRIVHLKQFSQQRMEFRHDPGTPRPRSDQG